jgi:hypothetical protein
MVDTDLEGLTENQKRYQRLTKRRFRAANIAVWLRAGGIQAVWLVVLIAGAAIPLTEAIIVDGWTWVSPVLGFVIVVAAGVERIFSRTAGAAGALDELRRGLMQERRLLLAKSGEYATSDEPFALWAQRSEDRITSYDQRMIAHNKETVRGTD